MKSIAKILREIDDLYVTTFNRHNRLNVQSFYRQRAVLYDRLQEALGSLVRSRIVDPRYARMKHALGLSTKSIVHTWRRQGRPVDGIPGFHKHYTRVERLARHLRGLGYVGIGLDGYYSYRQIQEACTVDNTDPACTRRVFSETGRFAGSVGGGYGVGVAAGYVACNLVLGLPTGGTSLLWCGIIAGGAGAFAGGVAFGALGERVGKVIYERRYSVSR